MCTFKLKQYLPPFVPLTGENPFNVNVISQASCFRIPGTRDIKLIVFISVVGIFLILITDNI